MRRPRDTSSAGPYTRAHWRGGGAAERAGLENRYGLRVIGGSNPPLSVAQEGIRDWAPGIREDKKDPSAGSGVRRISEPTGTAGPLAGSRSELSVRVTAQKKPPFWPGPDSGFVRRVAAGAVNTASTVPERPRILRV